MLSLLLVVAVAVESRGYHTDFTSYDSENWHIDTGCAHCGSTKDQCALDSTEAGTFGGKGLTMTTKKLSEKDKKCGASCESFHMTFKQVMHYGSYKVRARWFPESHASSGVGYLGMLQASGNGSASITFGFRGKAENLQYDGTSTFKTGCYADTKKSHNLEYIKAHARMDEWHEYELEWHNDHVTWYMDGKEMRKVTDKSTIPSVPMNLRIHTRSVECGNVSSSFSASVTNFSYVPCDSCSRSILV